MRRDDKKRQEDTLVPLVDSNEPAEALGLTATPAALVRRGTVRETKIRPSEKRRRKRQLSLTFTGEDIPQRVKALAERWGMYGPDGKRPNFSAVVEYLLLPQLEAAERGELDAPSG